MIVSSGSIKHSKEIHLTSILVLLAHNLNFFCMNVALFTCILLKFSTAHPRSCGKVIFSVVSVGLSFYPQVGSPYRTSAPTASCTGPRPCLPPDMFKLIQLGPYCTLLRVPPNTFKLVHYAIQTVRERAVGIRLKCLLVWNVFWIFGDLPI